MHVLFLLHAVRGSLLLHLVSSVALGHGGAAIGRWVWIEDPDITGCKVGSIPTSGHTSLMQLQLPLIR